MSWVPTYSGQQFDLLRPSPDAVRIGDIAYALSNIRRFTGHTQYSVAQHSVFVSYRCPTMPLAGLLHDAAEAYIGDINHPLKCLLKEWAGPHFEKLELRIERAIGLALGVDPAEWHSAEVKQADMIALATERRDVVHSVRGLWQNLPAADPERITVLSSGEAYELFVARWRELCCTTAAV